MSKLSELLNDMTPVEGGSVKSAVPGVRLFKGTKHIRRRPLVYNPGICIVASGHKIAHLGGRSFRYDANNYLVTSVSMLFECESFPGNDGPLLGMFIDIDMPELNELISQMSFACKSADSTDIECRLAMGPSVMSAEMINAAVKLLKSLKSKTESKILAPSLIREIYYRVLCGKQSQVLYSLSRGSSSFSQVSRVISMMEGHYSDKLDIQELADSANMSISAFHKAFKEVNADSPLQYLKKIRLSKAKNLLQQRRMKVYLVADEVGYESASQFSREFKRYFGQSPAEVIRIVD
jgi:AraC-like DNA-binding protein